jgi:hypothetical protein
MAGRASTLSLRALRFGYLAKTSSPVKVSNVGLILTKYKSAQVNYEEESKNFQHFGHSLTFPSAK